MHQNSVLLFRPEITMEVKMELEKAKDEVLRKIGRNMLLFQQLEHMLKYLIANGQFSGNVGEVKSNVERRAERVGKQTMGMLLGNILMKSILGVMKRRKGKEN